MHSTGTIGSVEGDREEARATTCRSSAVAAHRDGEAPRQQLARFFKSIHCNRAVSEERERWRRRRRRRRRRNERNRLALVLLAVLRCIEVHLARHGRHVLIDGPGCCFAFDNVAVLRIVTRVTSSSPLNHNQQLESTKNKKEITSVDVLEFRESTERESSVETMLLQRRTVLHGETRGTEQRRRACGVAVDERRLGAPRQSFSRAATKAALLSRLPHEWDRAGGLVGELPA